MSPKVIELGHGFQARLLTIHNDKKIYSAIDPKGNVVFSGQIDEIRRWLPIRLEKDSRAETDKKREGERLLGERPMSTYISTLFPFRRDVSRARKNLDYNE
jgi:hypothetical protein